MRIKGTAGQPKGTWLNQYFLFVLITSGLFFFELLFSTFSVLDIVAMVVLIFAALCFWISKSNHRESPKWPSDFTGLSLFFLAGTTWYTSMLVNGDDGVILNAIAFVAGAYLAINFAVLDHKQLTGKVK